MSFIIISFAATFLLFTGFTLLLDWYDRRKQRKNINWLYQKSNRTCSEVLKSKQKYEIDNLANKIRIYDRFGLYQILNEIRSCIDIRLFIILSLLCGFFVGYIGITFCLHPLLLVLITICSASAPTFLVFHILRKRERKLTQQLPTAIEMISRSLKSGQGLDESMREAGDRLDYPIGNEIRRIYEEINLGLSFQDALRHFEIRYKRLIDVKMLCAAMIIQRETGGNLTKLLDGLSHTIQERFRLNSQVRVLTAEGRLSAIILASLPIVFTIITWLIRPEYIIMLTKDPLGKILLSAAVAMDIFGFIVMFLLVRIDT